MVNKIKIDVLQATSQPSASNRLIQDKSRIEGAYRRLCEKSFMGFTRGLKIASQTGPAVFDTRMVQFQRDFFEDIAPSLESVRMGLPPEVPRWWIERTKKASKDADLAIIVLWLTCFPIRPFYLQVGAGDKTQASIVKERISHLLHWNPWLNELVEIVQWQVRSKKTMQNGSPMALMDIMSSDISGAHGGTPDVLLINELTHINKKEFAENLIENADGVVQGLVIIATNAGFVGTWQETWKKNALILTDRWRVHQLSAPAPWHGKATLEDAKRRNTPSRYARLWGGKWVSGKGDALSEQRIEDCFKLEGPVTGPEPGWSYVAGVDLGVNNDHSALVVLGVDHKNRKIKLAYMKWWAPDPKTGQVHLPTVKSKILEVYKWLRMFRTGFDPSQAVLMMQELSPKMSGVFPWHFVGANLTKMAECLINVVEDGMLLLYDEENRLRKDFGKFTIAEKSYGYKLEAVRDESGHADVGTALVIALPLAVELLEGTQGLQPDDDLTEEDDTELSEDEIKELPDEFKDLFMSEEITVPKKKAKKKSDDPFEGIL